MDISELIQLVRETPQAFKILGKGGRCLALMPKMHPDVVLLLETGKDSTALTFTNDRAHDRAVTFARQYDRHLIAGVASITNNSGESFVHADLLAELSTRTFGPFISLKIGGNKRFLAQSARLIQKIPGRALHYMDFVDPHSPIDVQKKNLLARDIAKWMFNLHHRISPGAMVANKIEQQYRDIGKLLTSRATNTEKHHIMVTANLREIDALMAALKVVGSDNEFRCQLKRNLSMAGVDFELLQITAHQVNALLTKVLPMDRIGLTHSDLHPANILVSDSYEAVNGVCDWMTGTIGAQSIDFAGLGLAPGLLPKVVREYKKLELQSSVAQPINYKAVYSYAALRQIFLTVKAVKNGFSDGVAARVAWQQVGEHIRFLNMLDPQFHSLHLKHKRQKLPPILLVSSRSPLGSHPSRGSVPGQ